ncbi:MAG: (p)ppGpp synthetase [Giesbergeria sp.]|jgi:ppGpp synthetase/RelA/SpoT-type nucleotidyltranferase|nr:(p)ppGpp synthetase [Giesbergeria sp.]
MPSLDFEQEESRFLSYYQQHQPALQAACDAYVALVSARLSRDGSLDISKVEGRVKDRNECIRKFSRKYRAGLEESGTPYEIQPFISDLIGIRVVCLYEDELEKVAQAVQGLFDVIDVTDKVRDVEGTEASFGYKGLHLDLRLNAAQAALPGHAQLAAWPIELQIRTIIQDSWSVLDHKIKYKKAIPGPLKRRINVLAALFELADREFRQIRDETEAEMRKTPDEPDEAATDADPQPAPPGSAQGSGLNAFSFLKIANHFFKDFAFEPHKVDSFVDDIHAWAPGITRARFNTLMRQTIGIVKRYKQYFEEQNPSAQFNPYTVIRHCLYLGNQELFGHALRKVSRTSFEAWLQTQGNAAPGMVKNTDKKGS